MVRSRLDLTAFLLTAMFAIPTTAADPPNVDSIDFDSMPIAAPGMKDVELILTALGGKAAEPADVERASRILKLVSESDAADVVHLADAPFFRKRMDAVYGEVLGRPATTVELLRWAASTRPVVDPKVLTARLRRIKAAKGRKLRGVVVDLQDRPVEGAVVTDVWSDWRTVTDAEGKFTFDSFSPQDFGRRIHAEKDELIGRFGTFRHDIEQSLPRIRIEPRKRKTATFLDPSGKPLRNAAYFASYGWQPTPPEPGFILQGGCTAPTNEQGKATVDEIVASDALCMPTARHRRYVWDEPQANSGVPAEFRFKAGVEIHGSVVDPNGRPLPGASVCWQTAAEARYVAYVRHITDRRGRFAFVAGPGECVLSAEHPDWSYAVARYSGEETGRGAEVTLTLSEGEYIEGRILRKGLPASEVEVGNLMLQAEAGGKSLLSVHHPSNRTISDDEGRFRFGPLKKGASFRVFANDAGSTTNDYGQAMATAGEKDVVINIAPPKKK